MRLNGKVAIVTGAGRGIGRALARSFANQQATVVVADIDAASAAATASEIGGLGATVDVTHEEEVARLVDTATREFGQVDLFCSNAGIFIDGGVDTPVPEWHRILDVNVMAHLYAARAVLPQMLERGEGYLLQTVSAAGLLTQLGSAPYAVTKHAALALAEWLSITYGDRGIKVSAICPQGVRTAMLLGDGSGPPNFLTESALSAEQVAEAAVRGIEAERFLILPHPEVAEYFSRKASDYDRWLRGMRRLQSSVLAAKTRGSKE